MLTCHPIDSCTIPELLALLNDARVRRYLMLHAPFTASSADDWLQVKQAEDRRPGCLIRAIRNGADLVGWCGIQKQDDSFELAIVLAPSQWSRGRDVLATLKTWGRQQGHTSLVALLPSSRPQRRAIARLFGQPSSETVLQGTVFNRYTIAL
ncbi:N-acetyltransferase [Synechococcus sp. RSCCF101]|uniref:GNAT family N-acetyltransferase n=1 Tax=Synechococcus sp. RSCCF101 TaxID=2511069 RepID=UPI001244CDEC|nr:GNAT family N-acetyltransferase [Synechococcus sp. RSCCF101]QEY32711.1 N-acetyltransferase [Synechococcus sp. RSCCF101]